MNFSSFQWNLIIEKIVENILEFIGGLKSIVKGSNQLVEQFST